MSIKEILRNYSKELFITLAVSLTIAILGFSKSLIFPYKNLSGQWTVHLMIDKSEYRPYLGATTVSTFQVVQSSNNMIDGVGEKLEDIHADGSTQFYKTVQRDRVKFTGTLEQPFIGKPKVFLEITNLGSRFTTTASFNLQVLTEDSLVGIFSTTIANGSGRVIMKRNR